MINRNDLLESIIHEYSVCKHLATKIAPEALEYRPTPAQRSTIELLRYLSMMGSGTLHFLLDGTWDVWGEHAARARAMTLEEFPAAIDDQIGVMREIFASMSDEEFAKRMVRTPWGTETTLEKAMLNLIIKWLAGYKMQLFLYAKANGASDIGTSNLWGGADAQVREPILTEAEPSGS